MYKVTKKFYDPLLHRRVSVGEKIEIPEEHLKGYKPYIQNIETAEIVLIKEMPKKKKKVK